MSENVCEQCGMEFESKDKLMEHARVHMGNKQVSSGNMTKYNARKVIGGSVAGAIIGGIAMAIILLAGASAMGLPAATFFMIIGITLGSGMMSATAIGLIGHFVVAVVVGIIFGAVVLYARPLRLTSIGKSLGLGIVAGLVLYLVFFLPLAMTSFAKVMMMLMGPKASMMMGSVLAVGLTGHLVYGLIVGGVAYFIAKGR
jgi:hypothetical protein